MSRSITSGGQYPPMNATDILCAIWASRRTISTQMNDKDTRHSNGLPIYTAAYPRGWHRHNYTEWIAGVGDPHPSWRDRGLEYRYWVQYDPLLRPREMAVPELVGCDVIYTPPPGYAMKKRDGKIVFYWDDEDHYLIRKHQKQNPPHWPNNPTIQQRRCSKQPAIITIHYFILFHSNKSSLLLFSSWLG
jgi:hypothetical protein